MKKRKIEREIASNARDEQNGVIEFEFSERFNNLNVSSLFYYYYF